MPAKSFQVDRKSTRLNSSHGSISYAVFCLKKKKFPPAPLCCLLPIFWGNYLADTRVRVVKRAASGGHQPPAYTLPQGRVRVFFFFNAAPPPESTMFPLPALLRT